MQVPLDPDAAAEFDRILMREVRGRRGLRAWEALLRAHATLLRQLETDLQSKAGVALADADARGVVVQLTNSGLERLTAAAPVHMRGVSDLFLTKLDDQELALLESALAKVTLDCTFG